MREPVLLLFTVGLNVAGQFLMKRGMNEVGVISNDLAALPASFARALTTPFVLLGVVAYGISAVLWLILLSRVDLSYAYPALSLGYVAIVLVSWLLLGEEVSLARWAGVFIICLGVWLVSRT
ncbi:MAG: EamA family transporter [Anaerolineae bacterium]|nr:EamA family transporter [Anaerolineae bacterium]